MAFNPVETSLYVSFSTLTHERAVLPRLAKNPQLSSRIISDSHTQSEAIRKQAVLTFTSSPSSLAPYQQIIYQFSQSLEDLFLTSDIQATDLAHDILSMNYRSAAMIKLHETQMHYLHEIQKILTHYYTTNNVQNTYLVPKLKKTYTLVQRIFDDSKPSINGDDYSAILDMADIADDSKKAFRQVNSIYLPE